MTTAPIPSNAKLVCGHCGKQRVLNQEWIERISADSFPNRATPEIYESDLPRFKCSHCNEKRLKLNTQTSPVSNDVVKVLPVDKSTEYQIITKYLNQTTVEEQRVLLDWAQGLQMIKNLDITALEKAKSAIMLTINSGAIQPFLEFLGTEIKRVGWDERGLPERMALSAAAVAALLFSGQGAGIAALGGAIGVPLWVVFGAGGAFVGVLINEAQRRIAEEEDKKHKDK